MTLFDPTTIHATGGETGPREGKVTALRWQGRAGQAFPSSLDAGHAQVPWRGPGPWGCPPPPGQHLPCGALSLCRLAAAQCPGEQRHLGRKGGPRAGGWTPGGRLVWKPSRGFIQELGWGRGRRARLVPARCSPPSSQQPGCLGCPPPRPVQLRGLARPGHQPAVSSWKGCSGNCTSPSRVASSMWRSDPQPRPLWDRSHFQENCKTLEEQMMDSSQSFPVVLGEVGWGRAWRRCHGVGGGGPCPHTARRGRGWPQGPGWATVPGERAAPRGQAAAGP